MSKTTKQHNQHSKRLILIKEFWPRLLAGLLAMTITVVIQLAFPKAISYFIDNIQAEQATGWSTRFAGLIFLLVVVQTVAAAFRYYLFESTGLLIVTKIRRKLHQALIAQPIAFYDKHNIGELSNRLSADVEVLHNTLTMGLAISLRSLCVIIGSMIMLLIISPVLSIMLLLFIPLSVYLGKWIGDNLRSRAKEIQACQAKCAKVAHENFSNIKLVHAYNSQRHAQGLYINETEHGYQVSVARTRFLAKFRGLSSFIISVALLLTLWLGANQITQGQLSVGELTSFIIYAGMLVTSVSMVSDFWSDWMRTIGATERIFEIMDEAPTEQVKQDRQVDIQGQVAFKGVDFHYPERPGQLALRDVNLTIAQGEKIAFIGHSGAGKSTIASLLLGYYCVSRGQIEFDGRASSELNISDIRNKIAIVEQEPSLFSGSIYDNIVYGCGEKQTSLLQVKQAAKQANADSFISQFPDGYHTLVGERGVQLSGGQKQRIAIARALIRDPKILILDEATSALDAASESIVQAALDNLMQGRTTMMIAHRYSTIAKADRIVVLEQGTIVEQGTHEQLSQKNTSLYNQLMATQIHQSRSA